MEDKDEKAARLEQEIGKKKKYRMQLDANWNWQKKKLGCRIRPENGNPAKDSLREVFAELAGVDLNELLNEMKSSKKKKEQANKVVFDHEGDKNFKDVLVRSQVLGATKLALDEMDKSDRAKEIITQNPLQTFSVVPKSPPKRVILELQRERAKPLRLPDQDQAKAEKEKMERRLRKQREARKLAAKMEQSAKDDPLMHATYDSEKMADPATVLHEYNGDLFSTGGHYLEGMLYLSRMADSSLKLQRINSALNDAERAKLNDARESTEKDSQKDGLKDGLKTGAESGEDQDTANETTGNADSNAKLHCAMSLCNWSRNSANARRLASEGAVRAINQLALEPVYRITMYCAAAYRFMSEHPDLANAMIDDIKSMATIITDLVNSHTDEFISHNIAIALVNLTRINGKEGAVVDGGLAFQLHNLATVKPELASTCVRGLYNLTCVDVTYSSIEKVIRALVALSMSASANVKHLCAAALCNLSDLRSVRGRMVEEGGINVLSTLSRGAETRTRRVCAVILQNLSAARSVRVEMASRGSVAVAYALSSDQDPIILRCIGLTLSRLAMETSNTQRIIHEGGVSALGNIAVRYPTIPGISQPVASAYQVLSSNQTFRTNIVNEGCVTAIAALLRSSVDMFTLQHSLLALCNLLCEPENHLQIIQQGLILTLISMCDHDNDLIKDFCSLAFLNLSCVEDSRKHLINAGAVVAVIAIATENSDATKKRCAATLCNLSYYSAGMMRMVSDGIIPSIVKLVLAKDIMTVHYACAALCRLCCTVENSKLILESGAVPNLVRGALEGDQTTKQYCGAVLSSLSFYESCRVTLCEMGTIAALKGLAELNDDVTKQRCLVAFANLSCEVSVQLKMIEEGVVSIIAELANSYQEINYICCAKAICNLACSPETKLSVATNGGVHALLMISMVQSVDKLTKLLCVLGLNNLLDESTIDFMLEEGLVGSIANLSKIGDGHISMLSAKIFNHLSQFPAAREKMAERTAIVSTLFKLCESTTAETQNTAMRTTCNLVLDRAIRGAALSAGAFGPLEKALDMEDKFTVMQGLISLFSVCGEPKFMEMMSQGTIPAALLNFATQSSTSDEEYSFAVKILAMLAWEERSRLFLQKKEFVQQLFKLIQENLKYDSVQWITHIVRFVVLGYGNTDELMEFGILEILLRLNDRYTGNDDAAVSICESIVQVLRVLATSENNVPIMANNLTIGFLNRALELCKGSEATMMDISALMYLFASTNQASKLSSATNLTAHILTLLAEFPVCADYVAASIGMYLMDTKARQPFASQEVALAIVKIAEYKNDESTVYNLVLGIFGVSKIASCREFLSAPPINMDRLCSRLSLSDNPKIKANCNRAYKNLNADVNEAIEEGAVASLIAMSLEGKLRNQSSDDFYPVRIHPVLDKGIPPPACSGDISSDPSEAQWFERVKVTKGGPAGKGPVPPEPLASAVDGSAEYPNMTEELDAGEVEGKTKMAFAKMQVPQSVRDSFMLGDSDFMANNDQDDASSTGGEGDGGAGHSSASHTSEGPGSSVEDSVAASGSPRPDGSPPPRMSRSNSIRGKIGRAQSLRGLGGRQHSGKFKNTGGDNDSTSMPNSARSFNSRSNTAESNRMQGPNGTNSPTAGDGAGGVVRKKKTLKPLSQSQPQLQQQQQQQQQQSASMGEQAQKLGLYA